MSTAVLMERPEPSVQREADSPAGAAPASRAVPLPPSRGCAASCHSPAPLDRRVAKTRSALRRALIQLTEERGLDTLGVGDICERADINRGTFYNHFADKEALVIALEDEVLAELESYRARIAALDMVGFAKLRLAKRPLPVLVDLFDTLREHGDFLHAMLGPRGDVGFGPRLRDCVCTDLVHSVLHERYRHSDDPFVGYYVSFYATAYMGVISRWMETGMVESSEEMARIAMRLLFIKPGESIVL